MSEPMLVRVDRALSPVDFDFLRSHVWPVIGDESDMANTVHPCQDCGRDIFGVAIRCADCGYARMRSQQAEYWRLRHDKSGRTCPDCGEDISGMHGLRKRCVPCQQEYVRACTRERARRRTAA